MPYINSRMKDLIERAVFLREAKRLYPSNQYRSCLFYHNNSKWYLVWDPKLISQNLLISHTNLCLIGMYTK